MPTPKQIRKIYALMSPFDKQNKGDFIYAFTNGQTDSISSLSHSQTQDLIKHLEAQQTKKEDPSDKMRKKIISIAWQMDWTYKKNGKDKADIARINKWCVDSSYLKKPLNDYKYSELPKLLSQFQIVYKSYLNNI